MRAAFGILFVIIVLVGAYGYFAGEKVPTTVQDTVQVETYVREHISTLSPEPAVLGGTFYVTAIEAEGGRGTVWYEDGHIALTADFEYVEDKYGATVTSFEVRTE